MLDWIFEGIITWISSIASSLMDAVSGLFLNALGADMTVMEEYFPFITVAYTVMQYMAWAILFLITVWQLFRTFGGPITEAEHPLHLIARSSIFSLLIGYARPIFMVALDIARAPYTALLDLSMTSEDFTFAGLEETLSNGLLTIASTVTVIAPILLLILLISIGWNYFKLLLETVERYIVVGVLCYTSPLAFAMGGSKETNQVFKSWCRMVGSQLLLLVMNVWFLRAFSSSVGQYIGNGGAVSTGHGSIFLWFFCALAFLKTAQRFDSYLASIGLNVAQTGSSMGMEMLMAARVLTGFAGSASSAGSVFRNTSAAGTATATGFAAGFANRFKPNSYVRDAVVEGGSRMGLGGSVGFVGRAFGGIAARNGATLTGDSISSVATRPDSVSGSIGGDIANRSLGNYMPQLGRHTLSNTQITGGHISTTATDAAGKTSNVELFNAAQFEAPTAPHSLVNAADGSSWYQVATGEGRGAFYDAPNFTGSASEAARVAETFPGAAEGTMLRTVGEGVLEATTDNGNSLWYNSAFFAEPDAPHSIIIRPNSGSSCLALNNRSLRLIPDIVMTGISKFVTKMVPVQHSMIPHNLTRPEATTRSMRTLMGSSGLQFTETRLWNAVLFTRTVRPFMMAKTSKRSRWKPSVTRTLPVASKNLSGAKTMISSHRAGNDKYIQDGPSVTFRWPVLFFRRITDGRTGKAAIRRRQRQLCRCCPSIKRCSPTGRANRSPTSCVNRSSRPGTIRHQERESCIRDCSRNRSGWPVGGNPFRSVVVTAHPV